MVYNNLNLLTTLGIKPGKIKSLVKIKTTERDEIFVDNFLRSNLIGKNDLIIGVCPGSGNAVKARRWPKENFISLTNRMIELFKKQRFKKQKRALKVIFFGIEEEKDLILYIQKGVSIKTYNTTGFTLGQTVSLINRLGIMIANDTGPMHLAAAQGIRTVGLFGPETPEIFAPFGKNNVSFFRKIHCSSCIKIYLGEHIECQNNICMRMIKVDEVLEVVRRIIKVY